MAITTKDFFNMFSFHFNELNTTKENKTMTDQISTYAQNQINNLEHYDFLDIQIRDKKGNSTNWLKLDSEVIQAINDLPLFNIIEVYVCTDCLMLHANDETDPNLTEKETEEYLKRVDLTNYALGDTEKEIDFSNVPCSACNTHLAGNRHHMNILEPIR